MEKGNEEKEEKIKADGWAQLILALKGLKGD